MIEQIMQMLRLNEFYGATENIEIAKGKYKIPTTAKEAINQAKRDLKWKRKQ